VETEGHPLAEQLVRLLASAANATRLYPPSSDLPAQAIERFVTSANEVVSSLGPIRYVVEPHAFKIGESELASGQGQVAALAEALHAMQVGQLVIAFGITAEETIAFLAIANAEPVTVRQQGIRSLLMAAGVSHIAVIEVTLRASEESGILGLDLTSAPLDDIAREAVGAAELWSTTATEGAGHDDMGAAIGRLEEATRDIAAARVAEALLRLDEKTRMRVLAQSLRADTAGSRASGMLDVIARMKPAALARLLMVVAAQAGTDPSRIAGAMELPPEVAEQVALLLAPSPRTEAECGVPEDPRVDGIAEAIDVPEDRSDLERQIAVSSPTLATGKALATTVSISRISPDVESVRAIGEAIPPAARDGAFPIVREALRRLDELAGDTALELDVDHARGTLQDPAMLQEMCRAAVTDADAAIAGEILTAVGQAGAEALIDFYLRADAGQKSLFKPVTRGMGEPLLTVASRRLRADSSAGAIGILDMLPGLGDKRAIPVIAQALENLDAQVRRAAVTALADTPGPEARQSLTKALGTWDPETKRFVIREIGRVRAAEALPSLVRILDDINFLERNHELKKEVVKTLESLGSAEAVPVLRRVAGRKFAFGRKNKELRFLARRAVEHLSAE